MNEEKKAVVLNTIQKENKLNTVTCDDAPHPVNNGHHTYSVDMGTKGVTLRFQDGPRKEHGSKQGLANEDLLEIVRHRLQSFQEGPYHTRENALALTHIEEALMWLNKRAQDRAEKGKLGTHRI